MTAGRLLALVYLFCVLVPGMAQALGDAASCLIPPVETAATPHLHGSDQQTRSTAHLRHATQADQHAMHHADAGRAMPEPAKHQHDGKGSAGPCCAMLCVSAIVADPPIVATPSPPISLCVSEVSQCLPGKAPPQLFRPPISWSPT